MINYKSPTCNAPIPAFPRVHMDGAAASALAKARLEVQNMHPWTQEMKINKGHDKVQIKVV